MGAQAKSQDPPTAEDAAKGGPRRAVLRRERPRYLKRKIVGRKKEEEIERKEERRESQEHNKEDKFTCIHIHIGGTLYVVRRSRSTILILSGQDIEIASLIVQTYITSQDRRNCLRERRRVPVAHRESRAVSLHLHVCAKSNIQQLQSRTRATCDMKCILHLPRSPLSSARPCSPAAVLFFRLFCGKGGPNYHILSVNKN